VDDAGLVVGVALVDLGLVSVGTWAIFRLARSA